MRVRMRAKGKKEKKEDKGKGKEKGERRKGEGGKRKKAEVGGPIRETEKTEEGGCKVQGGGKQNCQGELGQTLGFGG